MFIVIDYQNNATIGDTLDEAYQQYEDNTGETPDMDYCTWYEATEIKVKQKAERAVLERERLVSDKLEKALVLLANTNTGDKVWIQGTARAALAEASNLRANIEKVEQVTITKVPNKR